MQALLKEVSRELKDKPSGNRVKHGWHKMPPHAHRTHALQRRRKKQRHAERDYTKYTITARNTKDNKGTESGQETKAGPGILSGTNLVSYFGPPVGVNVLGILLQYL